MKTIFTLWMTLLMSCLTVAKASTEIQVVVNTGEASGVTQTRATLHGNVETEGTSVSSLGFEFKKASASEYLTITLSDGNDMTADLTNLAFNTTYVFRAFCIPRGGDPIYGEEITFETLPITVATNDATEVTQTHAVLNGSLDFGDARVSQQGFQYKKVSDEDYLTVTLIGSGEISAIMNGLFMSTSYVFRAFCVPRGGDPIYGEEKTFTTLPLGLATDEATDVTQTHATLNGTVNTGDLTALDQGFRYKQLDDTIYQTVGGWEGNTLSYTLSGLIPGTTYVYDVFCVTADNGTIFGEEKMFITLSVSATTLAATEVTTNSAILNGSVVVGDATLVSKGFEYRGGDDMEYTILNVVGEDDDFSAQIADLQINGVYEYRAFLQIAESDVTYYGNDKKFEMVPLTYDTIYIQDADMLRWLSEQCNNGRTFEGDYIQLMDDVTLSPDASNNMAAIGVYPDHPFKGTFNGNGMRIINLNIDQMEAPYQGLFGYTQNADLYDLGLVNINVNGQNYTSGLVAYAENTQISGCYVKGGVLSAQSFCGGLVGYQDQGTISGCYSTCSVTGNDHVGGLVGFSSHGTVSNSYVAGEVEAQGEAVGAIIGGADEVLMQYCYFNSELTEQADAIGASDGKGDGESMTSEQMRDPQFVNTLNQGLDVAVWKPDYALPINNGFPILHWQNNLGVQEGNVLTFTVYPNPTCGNVRVEASDLRHISVFNAIGQKVYEAPADGNEFEFDFSGHEAGVYLIRVETASGVATKRVAVTR